MEAAIGAGKSVRTDTRVSYRSGYYSRTLITRVGKLELRVPQDRQGRFSTEVFERYQRSEKALVATLAEMYVQGVSTRKVAAIVEQLCGSGVSSSQVSKATAQLDEKLTQWRNSALGEGLKNFGNYFNTFNTQHTSAKEITEESLNILSKPIKKPFFIWLHYLDTHDYAPTPKNSGFFLHDRFFNPNKKWSIDIINLN